MLVQHKAVLDRALLDRISNSFSNTQVSYCLIHIFSTDLDFPLTTALYISSHTNQTHALKPSWSTTSSAAPGLVNTLYIMYSQFNAMYATTPPWGAL